MIVLFNPLSPLPGSGRAPEDWVLVDGNVVPDPGAEIIARLSNVPRTRVPLLAVTVMPGPQLAFRRRWGSPQVIVEFHAVREP